MKYMDFNFTISFLLENETDPVHISSHSAALLLLHRKQPNWYVERDEWALSALVICVFSLCLGCSGFEWFVSFGNKSCAETGESRSQHEVINENDITMN